MLPVLALDYLALPQPSTDARATANGSSSRCIGEIVTNIEIGQEAPRHQSYSSSMVNQKGNFFPLEKKMGCCIIISLTGKHHVNQVDALVPFVFCPKHDNVGHMAA